VPWFWTHQFKEKVQIAGIADDEDVRVVSGDRGVGRFSVLHFSGKRLTCVESVNAQGDHMAARKAIGSSLDISPEQAAHPEFALSGHVKSTSAASRPTEQSTSDGLASLVANRPQSSNGQCEAIARERRS
jgi:3-phenylpropionate/trans-cinnamate dioxygenase ferredoxin reductase subunit